MMAFENIKIIDPYVENGMTKELKLTLATIDEVTEVEKRLNVKLPKGYAEYITTLGLGEYCSYIRIDMPSKILNGTKKHREYIDEYYFFWEMGWDVLGKESALESIKIADTNHGDIIIFLPQEKNEVYVLPRNDDMLHKIGSNLYEAIDWLCIDRHNPRSGSVGETHEKRYFVPDNPFQYTNGVLRPQDI